jgi:hypothetical protein
VKLGVQLKLKCVVVPDPVSPSRILTGTATTGEVRAARVI